MKIIVEVGSNEGQDTERFLSEDAKVFCFEPIPNHAKNLWDRFGTNENFHLLQMAVDIENRFAKFNLSEIADWGVSSLHNFAPDLEKKWNSHTFRYTKHISNMPCIRLDSFMNLYNISHIDYLHIDAQGNDFRVLQSLGDRIQDVKSGVCEAGQKVELYNVEGNNVETVKKWLHEKGFSTRVEDDGVGKPMATVTGNEVNIFFTKL